MTCTERCRRAHPGPCCCSCSGEHHGEDAPVRQLRIVGSESAGGVEGHARVDHPAASRAEPRSEKLATPTISERQDRRLVAPSKRGSIVGDDQRDNLHGADARRAGTPAPHHDPRESEPTAGIKSGPALSLLTQDAAEPGYANGQRAGFEPAEVGSTPTPGATREPVDIEVAGQVVHVSPATKIRVGPGGSETLVPRWCAYRDGRPVFADTPLEAARSVIGA